jgi:hypothetical protein
MKNKIREWAFPVVLVVSWMFGSAFTASRLVEASHAHVAISANSPRT